MSSLGSTFQSAPKFSLQQTNEYNMERKTNYGGFTYFVRDGRVQVMERDVIQATYADLTSKCNFEVQQKQQKRRDAVWFFQSTEDRTQRLEEVEKMETKSCDLLQQMRSKIN